MKTTKNLLFLPLSLALTLGLGSCKDDSNDVSPSDVPAAVSTSFAARFASVTGLEWERKGDVYEADFDVNNVDHEAQYNSAGALLRYKYDITEAELPAAIRTAISQNYANYRIDDAELFYEGASTTPLYQVELEGADPDPKLVYSANGQVLTQPAYWAD